MTRYQVVWPAVAGIRTASSTAVTVYAKGFLPVDALPAEVERLLQDGAVELVDQSDVRAAV